MKLSLRPADLVRLWPRRARARRTGVATLLAAFAIAGVAAPIMVHARAGLSASFKKARASAQRLEAPLELREVMPLGPDVDGDGASDFVNPTGLGPRAVDVFGSGAFEASRDGGTRDHHGVDYLAAAGQAVRAPISGYVTKIGYAYPDDPSFRYVELTNQALHYTVRVFYVIPSVAVGEAVRLGRPIGVSMTLQGRYPGISDHVHVEIAEISKGLVNPTALIPSPTWRLARAEAPPARASGRRLIGFALPGGR